MAVAQGYGKTVTSGSVFAYDVADFRNSYIGKPGYNVTGTPVAWVGNNNTSDFKTTIGTTTVNIPAIGTREVSYVDIWNTGASNCCPSLFRYGNWGTSTGVAGNTLYTYSIIYKTKSGYTHPNFMYRYEYNGGSYITEVGVFDTAKRIDLGDGWYQAYNTFTTNASTNTLYLGMWYYQYNVYDTVYLYKASLTQGDHVFSPEQIIPPYATRSATQGLLPLVGNSTIDLTNVSFDSNAQMTFDGTNDFVDTDFPATTLNTPTIEAVVYRSTATGRYEAIIQNNLASDDALYVYPDGRLGFWPCSVSSLTVPTGQWSYVAVSYNGTNLTYCVNGVTETITATCADITDWDFLRIGGHGVSDGERWIGKIAVSRVYNRALSAAEIKQNYRHYKTRFNLS